MALTAQGQRQDAAAVKAWEKAAAGVAAGDPDIELGQPFRRVENLVWIKANPLYKEALKDWERQTKALGAKLDRREKRSEELTNQVYNLVGFFSVFQGVILTAVTQLTQSTQASPVTQPAPNCPSCPSCPPRVLCGKVWFPVVLSGLAAVAAVVGIALKFSHLHSIDKLIHTERLDQRETARREQKLQRDGVGFLFASLLKDPPQREQKSYWLLKGFAVIVLVIAFSVILILSYFVILCDKWVIKQWH